MGPLFNAVVLLGAAFVWIAMLYVGARLLRHRPLKAFVISIASLLGAILGGALWVFAVFFVEGPPSGELMSGRQAAFYFGALAASVVIGASVAAIIVVRSNPSLERP